MELVLSHDVSVSMRAALRYETDDPYAVRTVFHPPGQDGTVEWFFSRDMLAQALSERTGQCGDVHMWRELLTVPGTRQEAAPSSGPHPAGVCHADIGTDVQVLLHVLASTLRRHAPTCDFVCHAADQSTCSTSLLPAHSRSHPF
ncbi:SsgA family sporulation/cell division regulator [Streptomyces sp. NPDC048279]|uniref:SsgA family sporulation/cell division regulator n=1 Tax=Streptomyces sp. NPDC048279 TaxID=3154714 RepID=UPI003448D400